MKKVRKSLALDVIDCKEAARAMPPKPMPKMNPEVRTVTQTDPNPYEYKKPSSTCVNIFIMSDRRVFGFVIG